jgi:hypothetical protein
MQALQSEKCLEVYIVLIIFVAKIKIMAHEENIAHWG